MLVVTEGAIKGDSIVRRRVGIFRFHFCRLLRHLFGIMTGKALVHLDGFRFLCQSMTFFTGYALEAVEVAPRHLPLETCFIWF